MVLKQHVNVNAKVNINVTYNSTKNIKEFNIRDKTQRSKSNPFSYICKRLVAQSNRYNLCLLQLKNIFKTKCLNFFILHIHWK